MSIGFVYGVIYEIYSLLVDPTDFLALGLYYPLRISFTTEVIFLASSFAYDLPRVAIHAFLEGPIHGSLRYPMPGSPEDPLNGAGEAGRGASWRERSLDAQQAEGESRTKAIRGN